MGAMMKMLWTKYVAALVAVLSIGSVGFAGVILSSPAPVASGPGLGLASVSLILTASPNNDNSPTPNPSDNNITVPIKRFDASDYIDLVFSTEASRGVSEYHTSEFVDNNTGSPWSSYRMQLGTGTGANFQLAAPTSGLDFDFPDYDAPPSSAAFAFVATPNPAELLFTGGIHGLGAQLYTFRIDVPDVSGGSFTLRQIPTAIPEPSSMALVSLGLLGFVAGRRSK